MTASFQATSIWDLVIASDVVSQTVLLGLFILSIVCIAIVIQKALYLRFQKKNAHALAQAILPLSEQSQIETLVKQYEKSSAGNLLKTICSEHAHIAGQGELNAADIEYLELVAAQNLDYQLLEDETYLSVLGTSAAVSPLIGLFGTVWGLVHAFISISQQKSADIAVVAPGIAEALLTTLAGLIVAIPAMIFFHYFSNRVRLLERSYMGIIDTYFAKLKRAA